MFLNHSELYERIKQGDRKAYDEIYLKYSYLIDTKEFKTLTREEKFSEYSDAIIKLIRSVRSDVYEGSSSLKTYLVKIFHNNCIDRLRKNSSNKSATVYKTETFTPELSESPKYIIQQHLDKIDIEYIKQLLKNIGTKCQELIELYLDGFKDKEIADMRKYNSADVVRTSRGRCIEKLRQQYLRNDQ